MATIQQASLSARQLQKRLAARKKVIFANVTRTNMEDRQQLLQLMFAPPSYIDNMHPKELYDRIDYIASAKKTMSSNADWLQLDGYEKTYREKLNSILK